MPDRPAVTAVLDGTADGLFTAVHMYYYMNLRPAAVVDGSLPSFQQMLGSEYLFIETNSEYAGKVYNAVMSKLSGETKGFIGRALLNRDEDKFFDIFRYMLLAFKDPRNVDAREQIDYVIRVHKLSKTVGNEAHNLCQFTRFRQTAKCPVTGRPGILYADISPKNDVLQLVCDHFTDRLCNERFIIHDVVRGLAGVYDTEECVIVEIPRNNQLEDPSVSLAKAHARITDDESEEGWQRLWTTFYNTLAIQERKNSKLRIQHVPKYFWKHMTEHKRRMPWE